MATDFIMPRLPDQHPPQQAYLHQMPVQNFPTQTAIPMPAFQPPPQPQQYTPQISPLSTSSNGSPTSPKSAFISRQQRPLFMPAVLRPTEYPSKVPQKKRKAEDEDGEDGNDLKRTNSSFMSLPGLGTFGLLSRRSTGDSGKCVGDGWNLDLFPKPTAPPTRKHWKADPQSVICDDPNCKRYFSYFTRRHHCRRCGNIFCDFHSAYEVPLDQDANYNPRAAPSRACGHCYTQFKAWRSRTSSQASSEASSVNASTSSPPPVPLFTAPGAKGPTQAPEVAQSVPRDWNWSTF